MKANLEAKVTLSTTLVPSGETVTSEESCLFSFNQSDSFAKAYIEIQSWVERVAFEFDRYPVSLKVTRLHFQGELNTREREEEESTTEN